MERKAVTRTVPPPPEGSNKKVQPPGPAATPLTLSAEAYTHGGVKKTKFEPKVPARRLKKLSEKVKSEPREGEGGGEIPKELQRLLQQAENDGRGTFRPNQRTSKVAFGFGGFSSRSSLSSAGFQHRSSSGGGASRGVEKHEFLHADGIGGDSKRGVRKNVEVFDLERYFPVTLPLRRPFAGDSQVLDEEEFGEDDEVPEEDEEDVTEAAKELGLTEKQEGDQLFFFQLPKGLPVSLNASGKKEAAGSAKLEDLGKAGAMGKLLIYESGAVKFKVGDVIFDALPGTEVTFAQELAAVNITTKHCGFLGEVYKRVVLTPDISNVLPDMTDLNTGP